MHCEWRHAFSAVLLQVCWALVCWQAAHMIGWAWFQYAALVVTMLCDPEPSLHHGSGFRTARCCQASAAQPCTALAAPLHSHGSVMQAALGTCCPASLPQALQHQAKPEPRKPRTPGPRFHAPQSLGGGTAAAAPPGPGSWTRCSRTGRPRSPPGSPGPHTWPSSARSHLAAARSAPSR